MKETTTIIHEKYSRWIRWSHWLNAVFLMIMIWSGILIYWANPAYIPLPGGFVKFFSLNNRLGEGIAWHITMMWAFAINGVIYFSYLLISGEWREIIPLRRSLKDAAQVVAHDLKLRKELPEQVGKINGAQRFAYAGAIGLGILIVLSGIAIHKPVQAGVLTNLLGGYAFARLIHFYTMIALVLFIFVHIAQVIRAGWNNLRAMIAGYEKVNHEK